MQQQSNKTTLVVGVVGHLKPRDLADFTDLIENLDYFKIVYFKASSEKLWLKEGDSP